MLPALTTTQMIEVDRLMVEEYGILLVQMMENAGRNLATLARRVQGGNVNKLKITALCGTGNNGGGGMAAVRHLANWGAEVQVKLTGEPGHIKGAPAHQWGILMKMGIPVIHQPSPRDRPEMVIDAIIGYGMAGGNTRSPASDWIQWANQVGCPIISLDTPSGLDLNTGEPRDPTIRAEATLTLALPKTGLLNPQARPYTGALYLADIGVPPQLYRRLGLEVGPIFRKESILQVLVSSEDGLAYTAPTA